MWAGELIEALLPRIAERELRSAMRRCLLILNAGRMDRTALLKQKAFR